MADAEAVPIILRKFICELGPVAEASSEVSIRPEFVIFTRPTHELGTDTTDYRRSWTARAFVPYYAQRMSSAIVMMDARGIMHGINRARSARLRHSEETAA